jgi:hypothetical protein
LSIKKAIAALNYLLDRTIFESDHFPDQMTVAQSSYGKHLEGCEWKVLKGIIPSAAGSPTTTGVSPPPLPPAPAPHPPGDLPSSTTPTTPSRWSMGPPSFAQVVGDGGGAQQSSNLAESGDQLIVEAAVQGERRVGQTLVELGYQSRLRDEVLENYGHLLLDALKETAVEVDEIEEGS